MTVLLSPIFNIPFVTDNDGNPLSGGKIFAYEAGSFSVLQDTWTTADGDVLNSNPIVLNSSGQLPEAIWLDSTLLYNLVLTEADGTTVLKYFDDVTGVGATTGGGSAAAAIWVNTPGATYLAPTQFLVPGNVAAEYAVGNRARLTLTGGFRYGTVTAVTFSSPNTTVTIALDAGVLDSSLSEADYSVLIAGGRTVDAGAVSYFSALPYSTSNTVGNKLKSLDTDIAAVNTRVDALRKVWTTSGTATYTITPSPAVTSYAVDMVFTVKFGTATAGAATLNVNGVGAVSLKVFDAAGVKQDPNITAGLVSDVAYDGTNFMLLDALPAAAAGAAPRGMEVFYANGVFTVPAQVYSIKVTCVGGGGGGGGGDSASDGGDSGTDTYRQGGGGGGGASTISYISTTPGTTYSVAIGAGGAGGAGGALASASPGTAGGTTSFGVTVCTAGGGGGGGAAAAVGGGGGTNGTPGNGGSTGTGQILIRGGYGLGNATATYVRTGGISPGWGPASREFGGGGEGGYAWIGTSDFTGGNGFVGLCVVEW